MTFGVIGSSFFLSVSNCWLNSYGKFGGATRRRLFAICEKFEGPRGRVQVNIEILLADDTKPEKSKMLNLLNIKLK